MFIKPKVLSTVELSNMRKTITNKLIHCFKKQIQEDINKSIKKEILIRLGPSICSQNNLKPEILKLNSDLNLKNYDIIDDAISEIKKDLESSGFNVKGIIKPDHYARYLQLLIEITW